MIHPCTKFHNVILYNSTMDLWASASGAICLAQIPHMPQFQLGPNLVQTLCLVCCLSDLCREGRTSGMARTEFLSKNDTVVAHVGISHKTSGVTSLLL